MTIGMTIGEIKQHQEQLWWQRLLVRSIARRSCLDQVHFYGHQSLWWCQTTDMWYTDMCQKRDMCLLCPTHTHAFSMSTTCIAFWSQSKFGYCVEWQAIKWMGIGQIGFHYRHFMVLWWNVRSCSCVEHAVIRFWCSKMTNPSVSQTGPVRMQCVAKICVP